MDCERLPGLHGGPKAALYIVSAGPPAMARRPPRASDCKDLYVPGPSWGPRGDNHGKTIQVPVLRQERIGRQGPAPNQDDGRPVYPAVQSLPPEVHAEEPEADGAWDIDRRVAAETPEIRHSRHGSGRGRRAVGARHAGSVNPAGPFSQ